MCSYSLNWGTKLSVLSYRSTSLGPKALAPYSHRPKAFALLFISLKGREAFYELSNGPCYGKSHLSSEH